MFLLGNVYEHALASLHAPGTARDAPAHDAMVTCLDSRDHYVMSGSLDRRLTLWDLRRMGASTGMCVS
jgi:hypothetical protein